MISVQKTEIQEEIDRLSKSPEKIVSLQEELELEKEKKEIISSLYNDWLYEYNVKEGKVTTISGNVSNYHFSSGKDTQTYLHLDDLHPDDRKAFAECCRGRADSSEPAYIEARVKVGEEYRWISLTTRALFDRNHMPVSVIGKISDIDTKKREEYRLREQAVKDAMTGLLNRTAFQEEAQEMMLYTASEDCFPALLIIDIDEFKHINDRYGHLFGDAVIISLTDAMKKVFGDNALLGRFGGDEFTVLLPVTSKKELEQWMEALAQAFQEEVMPVMDGGLVTCSIGAACYGEDGITLEAMFRSADSALYYVKEHGRNGYVVCTEEIRRLFADGERMAEPKDLMPERRKISDEVTEFAMELLAGSKDLKVAMDMLLHKIGKRFNLASITIREYNEKDVSKVNYIWKSGLKKTNLENSVQLSSEEIKQIKEILKKNMVVEIPDVTALPESSSGIRNLYSGKGIRALFQCPFVSEGHVFGYITYTDSEPRDWQEEDKQALSMAARVIANYLAREVAYEEITRKVELMKSLDEVTGLLRYDKFKEVAQKLLEQSSTIKYALISVDFAHFKFFNEVYGFRSGDEVLADFADMIVKHNPRAVASCRDYADNFLIMVIEKSQENLLSNIVNYNNAFIHRQNERFMDSKLELCCGVYEITNPEAGIINAIDNANAARKMIKEKSESGILLFEPSMRINRMREIALHRMIEEGIENREFCMYLQPKVSMKTGKLMGAEALARWIKLDGQVVSPVEFIPPLEKSGKIVQLDFYMYELLLKQLRKWKDAGYPIIPISVNLSRHHIKDENLVAKLEELVKMYDLDNSFLEIEITESAFIEDQEALIDLMRRIKERGFGVSIDDFGTGYSSLSMLTELPADVVKLDKEFLKHSESDVARRMLQNVIRLIKDNRMKIVCEGVETMEQAEFLFRTGCDIGQGYFFSKPIPVTDFEKVYFA